MASSGGYGGAPGAPCSAAPTAETHSALIASIPKVPLSVLKTRKEVDDDEDRSSSDDDDAAIAAINAAGCGSSSSSDCGDTDGFVSARESIESDDDRRHRSRTSAGREGPHYEEEVVHSRPRRRSWPTSRPDTCHHCAQAAAVVEMHVAELKEAQLENQRAHAYLKQAEAEVAKHEAHVGRLCEDLAQLELGKQANERSTAYFVRLLKQNHQLGEELGATEQELTAVRQRAKELERALYQVYAQQQQQYQDEQRALQQLHNGQLDGAGLANGTSQPLSAKLLRALDGSVPAHAASSLGSCPHSSPGSAVSSTDVNRDRVERPRATAEEALRVPLGGAVDPNVIEDGELPLITAVNTGCASTVRMLLSARANPNLRDGQGCLPLVEAVMQAGQEEPLVEVVEVLLKAGASPDLADGQGTTARTLAAEAGGHVQKLFEDASRMAEQE